MLAKRSSTSISLATETPSLVTSGAPKLFSMTTLRPRGPRVTRTALARVSTPRRMRSRALPSKRISFALMVDFLVVSLGWKSLDDAEHLVLAEDQVLFSVDLHLGAGVLADEHGVAGLHVERPDLAVVEDAPLARGDDLGAERLLLRRVGDDDPAGRLGLFVDSLGDEPVVKRTDGH